MSQAAQSSRSFESPAASGDSTSRLRAVMSAGVEMPISSQQGRCDVGQDPVAQRRVAPPLPRPGRTGRRRWCARSCGSPAASRIRSTLPWSAVMARASRPSRHGVHDRAPGSRPPTSSGRDRRIPDPGVAHHVRVRELARMNRIRPLPMASHHCVGDGPRAHLRRQVVGRHVAPGRHQDAVLARERLLDPAVEEVRHVGVLLGLGHVQLRAAPAATGAPPARRPRAAGRRPRPAARRRLVLGQGRDLSRSGVGPRSKARRSRRAPGPGSAGAPDRRGSSDGRPRLRDRCRRTGSRPRSAR